VLPGAVAVCAKKVRCAFILLSLSQIPGRRKPCMKASRIIPTHKSAKETRMLRPDVTIEHFIERQRGTLPETFGVRLLSITEGRANMEMTVASWMMAPNGFLHAASQVMLADTCAGYATIAHLPQGAKGFTTLELKSNFLGTAKEGVLSVEAVAEHMGRTTQIWSATVTDAQGRKLSLFRCSQIVLW
jgi:1,4-dihydroxy-2-naphthoyl-CoA hydrolase